MKFLTGDDTGILKQVQVEAQKVTRLGPQHKGDAAERLCWAGPAEDRESRVAVAFESGLLETRDAATGKVLSSARAAPSIRCLQVVGSDLLAISADGCGGIVRKWCGDECPEGGDTGADSEAYAGAPLPGVKGSSSEGPWLRRFELQGPIADACIDPCRPSRFAFGGGESDVKLFDLEKGEVCWRAKNVRENTLCLRVPVRVNSLSWATELAPSRGLLLSGSSDGKIRLYDVNMQRRPLLELKIGHGTGQGSGGYTGGGDDVARPVNCSVVARAQRSEWTGGSASVRSGGNAWSLFVADTMGTLREYDLRNLPTCKPAEIPPGRKKHLKWAQLQMPFRRGYKGVMGSIRAVDVHTSGEALVAVGLGRFAYVYESKKRSTASLVGKVYLKQKLCSVLFSSEARVGDKNEDEGEDDAGSDADGDRDGVAGDPGPDDDQVLEGFSDDEPDAAKAVKPVAAGGKKKKKRRVASADAPEATDAAEEEEPTPSAGAKRLKKRKVK